MFELISHFAGYGFNKSHAAGYAIIAYQTAWLKAHYPAEYMAALLTSSKKDKDRTALYLNECRSMGVKVLVPDVNLSDSDFVARDGMVTFGLSAVRNVGEGVVERIVEERRKGGPFDRLQGLRRSGRSLGAQQADDGVAHQGRGIRRRRVRRARDCWWCTSRSSTPW